MYQSDRVGKEAGTRRWRRSGAVLVTAIALGVGTLVARHGARALVDRWRDDPRSQSHRAARKGGPSRRQHVRALALSPGPGQRSRVLAGPRPLPRIPRRCAQLLPRKRHRRVRALPLPARRRGHHRSRRARRSRSTTGSRNATASGYSTHSRCSRSSPISRSTRASSSTARTRPGRRAAPSSTSCGASASRTTRSRCCSRTRPGPRRATCCASATSACSSAASRSPRTTCSRIS